MNLFASLFLTFFKIGAFTFGGGYAMLPIIQKEVIDKHHWSTNEEVLDYYAVSQCLPGMIAINTATFIGRKVRGIPGGIVAAVGVAFPSLIIIIIIAAFIQNFIDIPAVNSAFYAIRTAVAALILVAVFRLWKTGVRDWFGLVIFVVAFVLSMVWRVSPIMMVFSAIACGIAVSALRGWRKPS